VDEVALGVSRDLLGAEICCTAEGCRTVRSRAACQVAGGYPVYYRLDGANAEAGGAHGIAVSDDGTLYFVGGSGVRVLPPGGAVRDLGSIGGFTVGLGVDH